ncbi:MAG: hypothetical protein LZ173_02030 [Thaumarchaeota archaeon]|jgi:hypothetical protein|nr:hypothetical protein [Candidatus Geocrenenecus arthurdayi]
MNLDVFKSTQLAKLIQIKQLFKDARVAEIVDNYLIPKLQHLRIMDLPNYIFTLYLASREYRIFELLIPSEQEVDEMFKDKNKLYYFKAKYLARLMNIRRELEAKHPEKADRIESIVFEIAPLLAEMRRQTLNNYMFTVTLACKELPAFCNLIPSEEELKKLMKG